MTEAEIEFAHQRREHADHFVQTYWDLIGHDAISWVNPRDHHINDVLARKGIRLIESANASRYHWVATKIVRSSSVLSTIEVVIQSNIIICDMADWAILLVGLDERVCIYFEGCSVPLYECLFTRLGVLLPLSDFEVVRVNHLKVSPSQLHIGA